MDDGTYTAELISYVQYNPEGTTTNIGIPKTESIKESNMAADVKSSISTIFQAFKVELEKEV